MVSPRPFGGERLSIFDSPIPAAIDFMVVVLGGLSVATTAVFWLLSFTPWAVASAATWVPSSILMFPFFGWALLSTGGGLAGRRASRTVRFSELVPRKWAPWVITVFLADWVISLWSITVLSGSPEYDARLHRYYLDNHGQRIWVDHAHYVEALASQNRLFLGGALTFTLVAVAASSNSLARRRTEYTRPPQWLHPARPRPRTWLPTRALVALGLLGACGTAAVASLVILRIDAYTNSARYLPAPGSSMVRLAAGRYVVFVGCGLDVSCPTLEPGGVAVRSATGSLIPTTVDPSRDDLTEGDPFVGKLSLVIPRAARYVITVHDRLRHRVMVIRSPGEEAYALAGWIAALIGCVVASVLSAVMLLRLLSWRLGFGERWAPPTSSARVS